MITNIRRKMDFICPVLYSFITYDHKPIIVNDFKCATWKDEITQNMMNNISTDIITIHSNEFIVENNTLHISTL